MTGGIFMKQKEGYSLQEISGAFYLLPYGQLIADHCRGVQLNEAGVFLWHTLEKAHSRSELLECFIRHYQAEKQEIPVMEADLDAFLRQMRFYGMIDMEEPQGTFQKPAYQYLNISGISIKLIGTREAFSENFLPFAAEACENADLTIEIFIGSPGFHRNGEILIRNNELIVCEGIEEYVLLFLKFQQLLEARFDKSGTYACFYCQPPLGEKLAEELFHAVRFVYLYLAQKRGLFALHSASVLYQGRAWLFSGHSGMGKSTHTNLWNQILGTEILNGDLNLMEITDGAAAQIHGTPWCGTSRIADTHTYPLGGIVLLKQAKHDTCIELSEDEKALLVMQRLISPAWTEKMLADNLAFTKKLAGLVPVFRLECTKKDSAVYTVKKWVDRFYSDKK